MRKGENLQLLAPLSIAEMMMITGYIEQHRCIDRPKIFEEKKKRVPLGILIRNKKYSTFDGSGLKELSMTVGTNFILGG